MAYYTNMKESDAPYHLLSSIYSWAYLSQHVAALLQQGDGGIAKGGG